MLDVPKSLVEQRRSRVKSSIAVGFSTAVACGIGLWSGIGTLPAVALCGPAIADGLLGGYRGYSDGNLAMSSAYAGRSLSNEGQFSGEIRSQLEANKIRGKANVVLAVNMLGLVPILRGISAVSKSGRSGFVSLAKVPASDMTVSMTELNAIHFAKLVVWGFVLQSIIQILSFISPLFLKLVHLTYSNNQQQILYAPCQFD